MPYEIETKERVEEEEEMKSYEHLSTQHVPRERQ